VSEATREPKPEPTPTALATGGFLARVDNEHYRQVIENRAIMGGWTSARSAGLRDVSVSDAVVMGALDALWELFRGWAAECDDAEPTGSGDTESDDRDH